MTLRRLPPFAATALALALCLAAGGDRARGAAAVTFASAAGEVNLRSDGTPMDTSFVFQIGTFSAGFEPDAGNTGQWLEHWVALCDAAADPIPGATATYSDRPLPSPPFPAGTSAAGFSSSLEFDHNRPPFNTDRPVYIWGYDNRDRAGAGEWLLVTGSSWRWPAGTANPPAVTFSVGDADTVILGETNGASFHMKTAAVAVSGAAPGGYSSWLAANFSAATLADSSLVEEVWGTLADPDRDGVANVIEYFTASDPNDGGSKRETAAAADGGDLIFVFYQAKDTQGATATVEWSEDLTHWRIDGVSIDGVEDLGEVYRVSARIPGAGAGGAFARLDVRRVLD